MSLLPIPTKLHLDLSQRLRKERKKRGPVIKNPKSPEVKYRRELRLLARSLNNSVVETIVPLLRTYEYEYTGDAYAQTLEQAFETLRQSYNAIGANAKIASQAFVEDIDRESRQRFYRAMNSAVGVDLGALLQQENLTDVIIGSTRENVSLIRSIPEEYFKKIETLVFEGTMQKSKATSMIQQIQEVYQVTDNRARLIARDQTSKINAALTQQRQENLGIEEYVWRTAEDGDRVRPTHRANNGKTFRWDDPPAATGHPGHDIQCRCVAQPIIKI